MMDLKQYKKQIRDYKPLERNFITFNQDRWLPAFKDAKHFRDLSLLNNKRISRNTIIKVYRDYFLRYTAV